MEMPQEFIHWPPGAGIGDVSSVGGEESVPVLPTI